MAKNWEYKETTGTLVRTYTEKSTETDEKGNFKIVEAAPPLNIELPALFGDMLDFDEVQTNTVINGIKQKLDDAVARSKDQKLTEQEKRDVQETLWNRIVIDRKWNMEGQTRTRGESVPLKLIVPALVAANYTAESIAKMTSKSLDIIKKFIETGEED